MYKKIFSVTVLACAGLSLSLGLFQNCAPAKFTSNLQVLDSNGNPLDTTPITELKDNCARAKNAGTLKVHTSDVYFEDPKVLHAASGLPGAACQFGVGDNLPEQNEYMTARYRHDFEIDIDRTKVCDVEFEFPTQEFQYDDHFMFLFNDHVLASNADWMVKDADRITLNHNNSSVEIPLYDWSKIAGMKWGGTNSSTGFDYCLGKTDAYGSCSWPMTQQLGDISMSFDPTLIKVMGFNSTAAKNTVSFVITGDNDPSVDCSHKPLSFKVKTYYFE